MLARFYSHSCRASEAWRLNVVRCQRAREARRLKVVSNGVKGTRLLCDISIQSKKSEQASAGRLVYENNLHGVLRDLHPLAYEVLWVGPKGTAGEKAQAIQRRALEMNGILAADGVRDGSWLLWAHQSPFNTPPPNESPEDAATSAAVAAGKALSPGDAVNHIPGTGTFTSKEGLAVLAREKMLRVPRSYLAPGELELTRRSQGASSNTMLVAKGRKHGSVVPVGVAEALEKDGAFFARQFLQEIVPGLLVDGAPVDLGLYVLIIPGHACALRAYVSQTPLLRFAQPGQPFVKSNYRPAWQMASSDVDKGRRTLRALLEEGLGQEAWRALWIRAHGLIKQVLQNSWSSIQPRCAQLQHRGVKQFELVRFDFIPDQAGKPWLNEVNSSPNMIPLQSEAVRDSQWREELLSAAALLLKDRISDQSSFSALHFEVSLPEPAAVRRQLADAEASPEAAPEAPQGNSEGSPEANLESSDETTTSLPEMGSPEGHGEYASPPESSAPEGSPEGYAEGTADDDEILVPPVVFCFLMLLFYAVLYRAHYRQSCKFDGWSLLTRAPNIGEQWDSYALREDADLCGLTDDAILRRMDHGSWNDLSRPYLKIIGPGFFVILLCPVSLYTISDIMSYSYPAGSDYDAGELLSGLGTFLFPAGMIYAMLFGDTYSQALGRKRELTRIMWHYGHTLNQLLQTILVSFPCTNKEQYTLVNVVRHSTIQFLAFSGQVEGAQPVRTLAYMNEIWKLMPILQDLANDGQEDTSDIELLPEVGGLCRELGGLSAEYLYTFRGSIQITSWVLLEMLSSIVYIAILMIQVNSKVMELAFCFITAFSVTILTTICSDINQPYHGFFRVDSSLLKEVVQQCNVILECCTSGGMDEPFKAPLHGQTDVGRLKKEEGGLQDQKNFSDLGSQIPGVAGPL
ncbi:hypothetical protein CYMTET_38768 [Cymbomonas tetramitiformis]|uniref:Tubulin-tyrosine ligase n=1 Tax=Cymbomonas tetramitiformis TaxID=36881 RepID=A0AAE0F4L7_9CHLO|nr:hypothetical protein CYMTET_38768 [Cymbomonas tetramitiformis]